MPLNRVCLFSHVQTSLMEIVELSNNSVGFQEYLSGVKVCLESLRSTEVLFAGNTEALPQT